MAYYLLSLKKAIVFNQKKKKKQSYDLAIHDYKKREAGPRATYLDVRDSPINHITNHLNTHKKPATQPKFPNSA